MGDAKVFVGRLQPCSPRIPFQQRHSQVPGPGTYESASMIGSRQAASLKHTDSSFSFPRAHRDEYEKSFLTKELQDHIRRLVTKDCDYYVDGKTESTGNGSFASVHPSSPRFSFGDSGRNVIEKQFLSGGLTARIPPKNTLNVDYMNSMSSLGTAVESSKQTNPSFAFEHADRDNYERTYISPRHQYVMPRPTTSKVDYIEKSSMGLMSDSSKTTLPSYGFGTSARSNRERVYLDVRSKGANRK